MARPGRRIRIGQTWGELGETDMKQLGKNIPMGWQTAARALDDDRRARIRKADTREFVRLCSGLLARHIGRLAPRRGSGLVEQQKRFRRLSR